MQLKILNLKKASRKKHINHFNNTLKTDLLG